MYCFLLLLKILFEYFSGCVNFQRLATNDRFIPFGSAIVAFSRRSILIDVISYLSRVHFLFWYAIFILCDRLSAHPLQSHFLDSFSFPQHVHFPDCSFLICHLLCEDIFTSSVFLSGCFLSIPSNLRMNWIITFRITVLLTFSVLLFLCICIFRLLFFQVP